VIVRDRQTPALRRALLAALIERAEGRGRGCCPLPEVLVGLGRELQHQGLELPGDLIRRDLIVLAQGKLGSLGSELRTGRAAFMSTEKLALGGRHITGLGHTFCGRLVAGGGKVGADLDLERSLGERAADLPQPGARRFSGELQLGNDLSQLATAAMGGGGVGLGDLEGEAGLAFGLLGGDASGGDLLKAPRQLVYDRAHAQHLDWVWSN
jgi:hypothetical protein